VGSGDQSILEAEADYLLAVKDNQPTLRSNVKSYFDTAPSGEVERAETVGKEHGRLETRTHTVSHSPTSPIRLRWGWSLVENKHVSGGRVLQQHVLYLGEINSSQELAWRKSIEVLEDGADRPGTLALFPEDRYEGAARHFGRAA
jgi:hypothetical protein